MPLSVASTFAWGLISWAAKIPRTGPLTVRSGSRFSSSKYLSSWRTPSMITKGADRSERLGKPTQNLGEAPFEPVEADIMLIETGPGLGTEVVDELVKGIAVVLKSRNAARDVGFARHVGHGMSSRGDSLLTRRSLWRTTTEYIGTVDESEIERAWEQLSQAINEAIDLLRAFGESFWASRLEEGRAKVEAYGGNGLDSILGLFGGMGSFNDLVLHPMNGHATSASDLGAANERLWDLRNAIYVPAKALRHAFPS